MISRGKLISLLSLCLAGTFACGFSSFVFTAKTKTDTDTIQVGVGEVKTNFSSVIQFVNASTFTMTKSGFPKAYTFKNASDENQIAYYNSKEFSLKSIWKINPSTERTFTYKMEVVKAESSSSFSLYNFFSSSDTNASLSLSVYSDADLKNKVYDSSSSSLILNGKTVSSDITLVQYDAPLYLDFSYIGSIENNDFYDNVFKNCVSERTLNGKYTYVNQLSFSFSLNKKV